MHFEKHFVPLTRQINHRTMKATREYTFLDIKNSVPEEKRIETDYLFMYYKQNRPKVKSPYQVVHPIIAICTKGGGTIRIDNKEVKIAAPAIFAFLPYNVIQEEEILPNTDIIGFINTTEMMEKLYTSETFSMYNQLFSNNIIPLTQNASDQLQQFFQQLMKIKSRASVHTNKCIYHMIMAVIYHPDSPINQNENFRTDSTTNNLAERCLLMIQDNCIEHRDSEYYAHYFHYSAGHLNRLLKEKTGHTLSASIRSALIQKAIMLLFFTKKSIKEIAYELQFDNSSNFIAFVQRNTGKTPSELRSAKH